MNENNLKGILIHFNFIFINLFSKLKIFLKNLRMLLIFSIRIIQELLVSKS